MTKLFVHTDVDVTATAAVVLETPTGDGLQPVVSPTVLVDSSVDDTAAHTAPTVGDDSPTPGNPPASDGEQLQMREPHISMLYEKEDVMLKHFGVTQEQALRTQALLRLGVTDEDVRIAERLMASRSAGDNTQSKAEWLLGYTHAQMSYHKALEVLGVSEAVVEEERARRLGELGLNGRTSMSDSFIGREGDDICRGFFTKRRRSSSQDATSLGITLPGTVVFPPTTTRVLQLEEVCQSQQNRIEQLESQLAALSAKSRSSSDE